MVNDFLLENMPQTTINHLFSIGVDHCPHLMEMVSKEINHIKYFKFLNCLVENPLFMENVQTCWDRDVDGWYMEISSEIEKVI